MKIEEIQKIYKTNDFSKENEKNKEKKESNTECFSEILKKETDKLNNETLDDIIRSKREIQINTCYKKNLKNSDILK